MKFQTKVSPIAHLRPDAANRIRTAVSADIRCDRQPIVKVISCFKYATDNVSTYLLRTISVLASAGIRTLSTASVRSVYADQIRVRNSAETASSLSILPTHTLCSPYAVSVLPLWLDVHTTLSPHCISPSLSA